MERIFPCMEVIKKLHQKPTDGELDLLNFLDKHLPKDDNFKKEDNLLEYNGWLIFFQPYLNGTRPDIIIYNPKVGVQIFEVKDWELRNYFVIKERGYTNYFVRDSGRDQSVRSPFVQVEFYKKKLMEQLIPAIGESVDLNKKNYGLIKTAVFPVKLQ